MNLENLTNFNNHRPLLLACLNATGGNVLEFGMGEGSTVVLHEYCKKSNRKLMSLENNKEYFESFKDLENENHFCMFVPDWKKHKFPTTPFGVVFIDHAPAEQRHIDAIRFKDSQVVVVHDTEHEGLDYDVYKIAEIAKHFKYRIDFSIPNQTPRTTAFSNLIDVSKLTIPKYTAL